MLLIDIKILQNRAEKKSWILNTLPNGVTHLIMPLIDDIKPDKDIGWILPYFWCETESD